MEQRPFDTPSSTSSGLGTTSAGGGASTGSLGAQPGSGAEMGSGGSRGPGNASPMDNPTQIKEQGHRLAGQAVSQVKSRLADATEERKSQATGALEALGRTLRQAGDNLRQEGLDPVGDLGMRAADQVDRMADYLRRQDMDGLLRDVQRAARNHPEVFLGGALLCGILVGRFVRSSTPSTREVVFEPDFQLDQRTRAGASSMTGGDGRIGGFGEGTSGDLPPQGGWA